MRRNSEIRLEWRGVSEGPAGDGSSQVKLLTNLGEIDCRFHAGNATTGVLWVFGAGGGLGGPAGGIYIRLAQHLAAEGFPSLRLDYRRPGLLYDCVGDVLVGIEYLKSRGASRSVLVGHSFGGAVVITAGAAGEAVSAVAALSSQSHGTGAAPALSPRPLLLMHGSEDEVLPHVCSRDIYARAKEPKKLRLYPGCRHGLDQCGDEVERDLYDWLKGEGLKAPAFHA